MSAFAEEDLKPQEESPDSPEELSKAAGRLVILAQNVFAFAAPSTPSGSKEKLKQSIMEEIERNGE